MSWMSNKTGRPKEQGGHERRNISVDKPTDTILKKVGNKSKFIEQCILSSSQFSWKIFHEPNETINDKQYKHKTAATFVWIPNNGADNAVLSIRCYFQYRCTGKGLRFRMTINENATSTIRVLGRTQYTWSRVYTDSDFLGGIKAFPNQNHYTIEFQFKPQGSEDVAYVKDIKIFLQVADCMPAL